jgi:RNA polymerase sigma factor (TIGR02999 family)
LQIAFDANFFLPPHRLRFDLLFTNHSAREMPLSSDLTSQLRRCSAGDREIAQAVMAEVLPELHKIAVQALRREWYVAPLDPTELINEVWIRNFSKGGWKVENRNHFFAIAAQAMRWVLVDNARRRLAQRRKDAQGAISLDEVPGAAFTTGTELEEIVRIGELMEKLEKHDRVAARIFDLHYFAGFNLDRIAELTGLTVRQVRSRWEKARDWLKLHL